MGSILKKLPREICPPKQQSVAGFRRELNAGIESGLRQGMQPQKNSAGCPVSMGALIMEYEAPGRINRSFPTSVPHCLD